MEPRRVMKYADGEKFDQIEVQIRTRKARFRGLLAEPFRAPWGFAGVSIHRGHLAADLTFEIDIAMDVTIDIRIKSEI